MAAATMGGMTSPASFTPLWREPEFALGVREMASVSLGIAAWGLVTGMAMANAGLGVALSVVMSLTVYAGSAQLASLPLLVMGAPLWLIWGTALCVNLRFVIFSAQWRPFFMHLSRRSRLWHGYMSTDMGYVLFMKRYALVHPARGGGTGAGADAAKWAADGAASAASGQAGDRSLRGPMAYFWGGAVSNWVAWQVSSMIGIVLAESIPDHWGIGFAGTLALLALTCSLITDRITVLSALMAATAALAAYALPMRLNIVVAIAAAVVLGVLLDQWHGRQSGASAGSGART